MRILETKKVYQRERKRLVVLFIIFIPVITALFSGVSDGLTALVTISLILNIAFRKMWTTFFSNIAIFLSAIFCAVYLNRLTNAPLEPLGYFTFVGVYLFWIFNLIFLAYKLSFGEFEEKSDHEEDLPKVFRMTHYLPKHFENFRKNITLLFPIIVFFVVSLCTIYFFGNIYSGVQMFPEKIDPYYYSASTYFTVGYGDIIPATTIMKKFAMTEMVLSSFINIFFLPFILAIYINFLGSLKKK